MDDTGWGKAEPQDPDWVRWARRLHAIAQTGLTFSEIEYDRERYRQIDQVAAEIFERHSDAELPVIEDFLQRDEGYATPKVDVRGAVFRDGRILMVRERLDGYWSLPGGWADVNDAPSEAVEREIREESGYLARASKLAMVLDKSRHHAEPTPHHTYKLFFICDLQGGEATTSFETTDVQFFPPDALPELSLGRATQAQILRLFDHHREPNLPTDFD